MSATAADLRDYGDLPSDVPAPKLDMHLAFAERDLIYDAGADVAPAGSQDDWDEALLAKAMALLLPKLHVFTLNGAAAAVRTAEDSQAYFMSPEEVESAVRGYQSRYNLKLNRVVATLRAGAAAAGGAKIDATGLSVGSGYVGAV